MLSYGILTTHHAADVDLGQQLWRRQQGLAARVPQHLLSHLRHIEVALVDGRPLRDDAPLCQDVHDLAG